MRLTEETYTSTEQRCVGANEGSIHKKKETKRTESSFTVCSSFVAFNTHRRTHFELRGRKSGVF